MIRTCIGLLLIHLIACSTEKDFERKSTYFNLDSLLNEQIVSLMAKGSSLNKKVQIGEESELKNITPDSAQWSKEFGILRSLSISKSRNIGAFTVTEGPDKIYYSRKEKEKIPVLKLEIWHEEGILTRITGTFEETQSQAVYSTGRTIDIRFNQGLITNYTIIGYQKMILKDTVKFEVQCKVLN